MHGYVKDWKHLLRANVQQGQQVLRRLIKGRLRFEPRDDYYVFTGTGTLGPVVGSDLIHKGLLRRICGSLPSNLRGSDALVF